MANMAPVVNTRGPLYVHPGGIVMRPTYHVLWMYANLLAEQVADAFVSSDPFTQGEASVPALDAVVTCDASRRHYRLALLNRHPDQTLLCSIALDGRALEGTFKATVLDGDSPDAYNDIDQPERVFPASAQLTFAGGRVALPPHSLTVLEGRLITLFIHRQEA